jgi:cell pole-organizing protein PopZ
MAEERSTAQVTELRPDPSVSADVTNSVRNTMRKLTERSTQVHSNGPTLMDIVREEVRPLLKEWLDANLPQLVERLVQAEIERVSNRIG